MPFWHDRLRDARGWKEAVCGTILPFPRGVPRGRFIAKSRHAGVSSLDARYDRNWAVC